METDFLLPTIKESDLEEDESSYASSQAIVQRRRSPYFFLVGAALVFLTGFVSSLLIPSNTFETSSGPIFDMLGRDREPKKEKHNKHHHNHKHEKHVRTGSQNEVNPNSTSKVSEFLNSTAEAVHEVEEIKSECDDGGYAKRTLKRALELPFAALFLDNGRQTSFDAAGVIKTDKLYAVAKNSWSVARFGPEAYAQDNTMLGNYRLDNEDSDYSALFQESGLLFAVRGSVPISQETGNHAVIEEFAFNADKTSLDFLKTCPTEWQPSSDSEGLEGAVAIRDSNNDLLVLALCGANHCGLLQDLDGQVGNGLLLVLRKEWIDGKKKKHAGRTLEGEESTSSMEAPQAEEGVATEQVTATNAPKPEEGVATEAPKPEEVVATEAPKPEEVGATEAPKPEEVVATEAPKPDEVVATEAPKPEEVVATEAPKPEEVVATEAPKPEEVVATEAPKPEVVVATEVPKSDEVVATEAPQNESTTATEAPKKRAKTGMKHPKQKGKEPSCFWTTIRTIQIPKTANFPDYSDITLDAAGRVAISSQGNSQVWVGQLKGQGPGGLWDVDSLEFDDDASAVYSFPKNDDCATVYCNIEGIHWWNSDTLLAVSGKVTAEQDFRCFDKSQSVHAFVLPE